MRECVYSGRLEEDEESWTVLPLAQPTWCSTRRDGANDGSGDGRAGGKSKKRCGSSARACASNVAEDAPCVGFAVRSNTIKMWQQAAGDQECVGMRVKIIDNKSYNCIAIHMVL